MIFGSLKRIIGHQLLITPIPMTSLNPSNEFISVLEAHKGILYKIGHSYCRDPDDQKDLLQEMVIQLWNSFDRYNGSAQYSTWIYRIALNTAISFYRKETKRERISVPFSEELFHMEDPVDETDLDIRLQLLQQFIQELKELDRALMLLYLEEKSYREIAAILPISESNVATKIGRIKKAVQQKFIKVKS